MALPAGRYGVTKNQLLKIKKLPMNTIKLIEELAEKFDLLGTAAFKNSTSVVTDSTDLVESAAVEQTLRDAEVVEGKNLYDGEQDINFGSAYNLRTITVTFKKPIGAGTYTLNYKATGNGGVLSQVSYDGSYHKSPGVPYTFTVTQSCDSIYLYMSQEDYDANKTALLSEIQIEKGSQATAYQPYYVPLKDVIPQKADNSIIAPTENGTTASQAYAVNDVFIRNGALCKVTSAISQGDTLSNQFTVTNVGAILTALLNA